MLDTTDAAFHTVKDARQANLVAVELDGLFGDGRSFLPGSGADWLVGHFLKDAEQLTSKLLGDAFALFRTQGDKHRAFRVEDCANNGRGMELVVLGRDVHGLVTDIGLGLFQLLSSQQAFGLFLWRLVCRGLLGGLLCLLLRTFVVDVLGFFFCCLLGLFCLFSHNAFNLIGE
ncbi:MAG: hypothetical protein J6Q93_05520 [Prevotella sp.]|nr:hypothetical protein [Prevotella sp.]